jgi:hypothetical protein
MSFFGKFLAVLNLAALLGFVYMATADLQMRKAWSYAVFRWDVALDGMPIDEADIDLRGRAKFHDFGEALSQELVGRSEIRTQEDFLDYRINELTARIDDDKIKASPAYQLNKDPKAKPSRIDKLVEVLVPLTSTAPAREALMARRSDTSVDNENKLRDMLEARIKSIKETKRKIPDAGTGKQTDETDYDAKRLAIGRALVGLLDVLPTEDEAKKKAEDPLAEPVYRVTANVLGARTLSTVLDLQAREYLAIGQAVADVRREERNSFVYRYQSLIGELMNREHQLQEQKDKVAVVLKQAKEYEERAQQQEEQVKDKKADLDKKRKATEEELKKLEAEQEKLYYYRLRLRDANQTNQRMEQEIRKLEKEVESENP